MIPRLIASPASALVLFLYALPLAQAAPYEKADWQTMQAGKLNISLYAFRDDNRNGEYDVGDPPMAGDVVNMTQPGGTVVPGKSNINGYANFKMSLNNEKYPVREPGGTYEFEVVPPPGWQISTRNPTQSPPRAGSPFENRDAPYVATALRRLTPVRLRLVSPDSVASSNY